MKLNMNSLKVWIVMVVIAFVTSCSDDDPIAPFNVNFTNATVGVSNSAEVSITFSRAVESNGTLVIDINSGGLTYGTDADYFTTPAAENDQISLAFVAGDASVSFTVTEGSGLNIQQDETITFTIAEGDGSFELGQTATATATFTENFIAPSGTVEIDGGGEAFPNQAFIDLSKLNQTTADKYSWDLGFHTSAGSHQVTVNNSAYVMARPLQTTDIDAVTATDTAGFAGVMYLSNYEDPRAAGWIDHQNGDLNATAIGAISATDAENPVYIIKRDGEGRNWKKVRILQDGDNYTILHADIDASSHTSTSVTKDAAYNFTFLDLDNGPTSVAPETGNWDLMYSTYANRANFGTEFAVGFNDFVIINRTGVSVAMVTNDVATYEAFSAADLASVQLFGDRIDGIGSSWRSLVNFALVLNEDRFYVIQDGEGQLYKLKFTRLTSLNGERGYPEITFELVQ